jgi:trehalose 6-phosphate phosphatase
VLLLDFDGTLAPFEELPEQVKPYPEVLRVLDEIMEASASRVVIVTGRRLEDVPAALHLKRAAEIWGAHGWQRRMPDGTLVDFETEPAIRRHLAVADTLARALSERGARVERKIASVAVHWRGLDGIAVDAIREALRRDWRPLARAPELEVLEFDGGLELRIRGRHKGSVVETVLAEAGPDAVAAYLGDDTTDEDAFAALRGRGIGVLVRPLMRSTRAHAWLRSPGEVTAFLEQWRDSAGGPR